MIPEAGIGHRAHRVGGSLGDRSEVAKGVVGQLLVDERVCRHRAYRGINERVAVGSRFGRGVHANNGVGPRAILHNALLAPKLVHLLRQNTRLKVHPEPAACGTMMRMGRLG